ncbi:hypothetical protein PtB15_17B316 [Puccinia triticina]|nr:hypothetical protein PtB15_17B316 [Puccinia triticina]
MTLGGLLQQTAGQLHQLIAQQPASRKNSRKTQPSWPPDEWFSRPASSHPPTSFRPPPLHPSRTNQPLVKETLDAHSSFSEAGQKQVNQYLIKQEIGRGSFGAVQLAEDAQTGLSYAIKELSKTRLKRKFARELMLINQPFIDHHHHDALFLIRNEVAIMKKIRHHNLVRLHEPDNLLLSSDKKQLKVVDFGISAMFVKPGDDSTVSRTIGSPAFLSVTLYFMLTGSLPFPSEQIMAMYDAVENQAPAIPDEWDGPLLDLMSRILDKQPSTRIKMASLRGHGWLTNGGKLPPVDGGEPSPRAGSVPDKCRGPPGEAAPRISETELSDSFRFGFTNRCPVFSELELFFKEFHRQISERTKTKFQLQS